jgi:uncharacterized protein YjlB
MSQDNDVLQAHGRFSDIVQSPELAVHLLEDDGSIPNNKKLPLLVYQGALALPGQNSAATVESLFRANNWGGAWRNGIYSFHHYHSTAHEVLAVCRGAARVQLGGEQGPIFSVKPGDVILIPAGVGHKNLGADSDFLVVGAYPPGQSWDMNYGKSDERPAADRNIAQTPLPQTDPVFGSRGPMVDHWLQSALLHQGRR